MNIIQVFLFSFEALKERRLRASLTTLMVIMGASLIVSLNGTGNGFRNFVDEQFSSLGANVLILSPRSENLEMNKALAQEMEKIDGVKEVIPYIQQISLIISRGDEQKSIVVGVDQSKLPLLFPTISYEVGTYVSESDSIGIVLGYEVARSSDEKGFFANLGQTVKIRYRTYQGQKPITYERSFIVRGILKYIGSGVVPVDQMVFISTSAANNFFNRKGNYDGFYLVTENSNVNEKVRRVLQKKYGDDLVIISPQVIANMIHKISSGIYIFIRIVAMVSLLVASVGIITTLQTSVMERIKEIGLLKALGFTQHLILLLFLAEAMIIGILGGSIGVLFGIGLSYGMSALLGRSLHFESLSGSRTIVLHITPAFDLWNIISTWILCVVLSIISGLYPSWRASRLDPVVALRYE
ncbi:TPA: ABC transporter permease [Candidatus Bathyarchaeota archaeon]|nr:ABC transporter permease [Candidatus Bathyarchaeota archaeon]